MLNATHTATDFGSGLIQHRVQVGVLVAAGLAAPGMVPASWTVTRLARRCCRGQVRRVGLVSSIGDLGFCDSKRLAGAVRRAMYEAGLSLRAAA